MIKFKLTGEAQSSEGVILMLQHAVREMEVMEREREMGICSDKRGREMGNATSEALLEVCFNTKKEVDVTKFIPPHGRQELIKIALSDAAAEQAEVVKGLGGRLTIEVLTTGQVSNTIEFSDLGDVDIRLTRNLPESIAKAFEDMLAKFSATDVKKKRKESKE
jgi:hypothetical protein